ncbi:tellurite resistance protein [Acinetobacter sp. Ver3]|nr:tellurite resistance protein [Acinetobacter sp. Ver3]
MKTIDYYNQYADQFLQVTLYVDMESLYQPFLAELPDSARILDLGCGSGRDTLAFKNKGYQVDAIDYSEVLVERASQLTGIAVQQQSFYELDMHDVYDGVWA